MGLKDKISNAVQDLKGKGKEAGGRASDNEDLESKGKSDQTKSSAKDAGENIKDTFRK